MVNPQEEIMRTLSLIEGAKLPNQAGPLLRSFIEGAMTPVAAALYVREGIQAGNVHSLVSNWIFIVESGERILEGYPALVSLTSTQLPNMVMLRRHRAPPLKEVSSSGMLGDVA
jgi:hypothetical protein